MIIDIENLTDPNPRFLELDMIIGCMELLLR